MTVLFCVNLSNEAEERMLDLVYDSSTIMIRIWNDQMMAFIMLSFGRGSAINNINSII